MPSQNNGNNSSYSWKFTVNTAPQIGDVTPADKSLTGTLTPIITAKITDNGSISAISLKVDGVDVPVTYDPAAGTVTGTLNSPVNNYDYDHTVQLTVTDGVGLTTSKSWTFLSWSNCTQCHVGFPVQGGKHDTHNPATCGVCHDDNQKTWGDVGPIADCAGCHPD